VECWLQHGAWRRGLLGTCRPVGTLAPQQHVWCAKGMAVNRDGALHAEPSVVVKAQIEPNSGGGDPHAVPCDSILGLDVDNILALAKTVAEPHGENRCTVKAGSRPEAAFPSHWRVARYYERAA
jgi:hypothetical protein